MSVCLDDVRPMPAGFEVHVTTAAEAIELLRAGGVTHVSFDNDLGDLGEQQEGRHVAMFVEESAFRGELRPFTWAVHSANPVGRRAIEDAMQNAERFWRST